MLTTQGRNFMLDGKPFHIYSGTIHYFRVHPAYWEDRLLKLKTAGFNTVETYVCWNLHEPEKGKFDFSGMLDLVEFLKIAQKVGLYALVRPGPYICAEWDFGGLPAWLLQDRDMGLRCSDPTYMAHVADFFRELLPRLAPLQQSRGGNILAMQVENEYGSYGNDKIYLAFLRDLIRSLDIDCLLFTSDGPCTDMLSGGRIEGALPTLNFGSAPEQAFSLLEKEDIPYMCTEFWCGWFDHWGEKHHTRDVESLTKEVQTMLDMDANFNVFVFHGGTNFGFTAGANEITRYNPTVTSYDYCAPLNEYGDYTPRYYALRDLMWKHHGMTPPPLPPAPRCQNIGTVALQEETGLFENLKALGTVHHSPLPRNMEAYGQNFGLIYYETVLPGDSDGGWLTLRDLRDKAWVYLNDELVGNLDISCPRGKLEQLKPKNRLWLPKCAAGTRIGVLVEAMGRVNYGPELYDRKGLSAILIGNQILMNFTVTTIPLENPEAADFTIPAGRYPKLYRGEFRADSRDECFVKLDHFTKGMVWVNGFNLGRFWNRGPQKTLYLPGALLELGKMNKIVVLELVNCDKAELELTDTHDLG